MSRYASETSVSVESSRAEIERILARYGASRFGYGWDGTHAVVTFAANDRVIRFDLELPDKNSTEFTHHSRGRRTPDAALKEWEQACRQRWRALALVVKAKLEAVASGIAEFEQEFLAYVVLPDGSKVGDAVRREVATAYATQQMPAVLLGPPALPRGKG